MLLHSSNILFMAQNRQAKYSHNLTLKGLYVCVCVWERMREWTKREKE